MSAPILVAGLINIETTLRISGFPLPYSPVNYPFFGVRSTVSGVGYNIAKALTTLGSEIRFLSLIGADMAGEMVNATLTRDGLPIEDILPQLPETAQSVILYEESGRRQIHVDLKDIQEQTYPPERFETALAACEWVVACNINFTRPFLERAKAAGKRIITDVHTIGDLDDSYNRDYMAAADILFMSHENLPMPPAQWAAEIQGRFGTEIIVIGMGGEGAHLAVRRDNVSRVFPAVTTRPIVNTIGAGDALFSAFTHFYLRLNDPYAALRRAIFFASYKIGESGAAEGFLDESALEALYSGAS